MAQVAPEVGIQELIGNSLITAFTEVSYFVSISASKYVPGLRTMVAVDCLALTYFM